MHLPIGNRLRLIFAALGTSLLLFTGAAQADEMARAKELVKTRCAKCHGIDGRGIDPRYASLAGQHSDYLVKQIFNFKTRMRVNQYMEPVADRLTAAETHLAAKYFSSLPPGITPASDQELRTLGQHIYAQGNPQTGVANCAGCHGVYATGGALLPRLAGQNQTYLENQIRSFIHRTRLTDRRMHHVIAAMTEKEISAVSMYLAAESLWENPASNWAGGSK
ncbi:MAG TPA: c-type cytochrome [Rhodocyclaceae bacterium]